MVNLKTDENLISAVVIATGLSLYVFLFQSLKGARIVPVKTGIDPEYGDGTPIKS